MSPCPGYFQYGLFQGKLVGLMEIKVPKTKIYGFNVTQVFQLLATEFNSLPRLRLVNRNQPELIVEKILKGDSIRFITEYPQTIMDFKIVKILLNDQVICEERESKFHAPLERNF